MRWKIGIAATGIITFAACASTSAPKSACSTGPAYPEGTDFPLEPPTGNVRETCTPRCEASKPQAGAGMFYLDALPSGTCTFDGELCGMEIRHLCQNGAVGAVDGIDCTCTSGNWRCAVTSSGGGGCDPSLDAMDAGSDAADAAEGDGAN